MLVLTRQRDQAIIIGDEIEISIVDFRGDKVRIGITAPRHVSVHRKEIYEAIRKENMNAAQISPEDVSGLIASPTPTPHLKLVTDEPADDASFMDAAIAQAKISLAEGGEPTGAVLVRGGRIIGHGRSQRLQQKDPLAHAELNCLRNAGAQKTYRDTILYSTLMPCLMCAAAIVQLGIPKVIVGDASIRRAGEGKQMNGADLFANCGIEIMDLHHRDASSAMEKFVAEHGGL